MSGLPAYWLRREFDARHESVSKTWTDPMLSPRWYGPEAEVDCLASRPIQPPVRHGSSMRSQPFNCGADQRILVRGLVGKRNGNVG